jgi:4-hydroxy-tetrahydrodipicolinate reductase
MLIGLGAIGSGVARQMVSRKGLKIVAAVDIDSEKVGRDVGDVAGLGRKLGIRVTEDPAATLRKAKPEVAVLCTDSSLRSVAHLIETLVKKRVPVVSTTEELAYPWHSNRRLARRIDALARKAKVAVVGTGVNPGFAMDAWPITLTGICERVDAIRIERVQDARARRLAFQKKIGCGLSPEDFVRKVQEGTVRHVGFAESVAMIADALGWKLDRFTDEIAPRVAEAPVASEFLRVERGQVCGIVQEAVGYRDGKPAIMLHLEAYLGPPETYDAVKIEGEPPVHVRALGGFHGDVAGAALAVNSIPKVMAATPGLHTMRSLPIPSFFAGGQASR